jgi:hypothetical protein
VRSCASAERQQSASSMAQREDMPHGTDRPQPPQSRFPVRLSQLRKRSRFLRPGTSGCEAQRCAALRVVLTSPHVPYSTRRGGLRCLDTGANRWPFVHCHLCPVRPPQRRCRDAYLFEIGWEETTAFEDAIACAQAMECAGLPPASFMTCRSCLARSEDSKVSISLKSSELVVARLRSAASSA